MIDVKDLHKSFGENHILKGVTTTFEAGKTNLIIGESIISILELGLSFMIALIPSRELNKSPTLSFFKIKILCT